MISVGCAGASRPGGTPATRAAPLPAVSTTAMDAHLKYLADDLLEGRAPATRGGLLAARYIAAQFEALGLEPAARDGSYFQSVALVGMTPHPSLVWGKGGATRPLTYLDDFVAWAERPERHIVADGEVVFVGYGVAAAEWRWDDYKDMDVRGKVLLMLVNDPGLQDSTVFNGRALTYYGRWTYKLEEAARRGAGGAILLHTAESRTFGWDVVLGAAEALVQLQPRPRRTLLFVATTAEESGLLGSEAYTRDPLVPLDQTAAVLNLDVANVRGATRDIDALGLDRSTLGAAFEEAARAESLAVAHEPAVRGSSYRSAHLPL